MPKLQCPHTQASMNALVSSMQYLSPQPKWFQYVSPVSTPRCSASWINSAANHLQCLPWTSSHKLRYRAWKHKQNNRESVKRTQSTAEQRATISASHSITEYLVVGKDAVPWKHQLNNLMCWRMLIEVWRYVRTYMRHRCCLKLAGSKYYVRLM